MAGGSERTCVLFSLEARQRLLINRELTLEEVGLAQKEGLDWVTTSSKLLDWPRGNIACGDELFVVVVEASSSEYLRQTCCT